MVRLYTDRKDCRWSANTVTRILQDETYTGTLVQGRKGSQHFKLKEMESRPSSEWIRVENAHEAIIDRNDFDLVQRIRNLDTRTSPQKDKVYLFSGILVCGCCGSRMVRKTNRYKDKEYHYYYSFFIAFVLITMVLAGMHTSSGDSLFSVAITKSSIRKRTLLIP